MDMLKEYSRQNQKDINFLKAKLIGNGDGQNYQNYA